MVDSGGVNLDTEAKADRPHVNWFELAVAIMLGAASVLTAVSSLQSSMWNGRMSEYYSLTNQQRTAAAAETSKAIVTMAKDSSVVTQALQLFLESVAQTAEKDRLRFIAGRLLVNELSDAGYKAMEFPAELRAGGKYFEPTLLTARETDQMMLLTRWNMGGRPQLTNNESYQKEIMAESARLSDEAERSFAAGIKANENGDRFGLANVVFAISLFFNGIALVFRTKIRWVIFGGGILFLACGVVYMIVTPWTFS